MNIYILYFSYIIMLISIITSILLFILPEEIIDEFYYNVKNIAIYYIIYVIYPIYVISIIIITFTIWIIGLYYLFVLY